MKKLITTEPTTAEKLMGKIREIRENLSVRKNPEAREQLDFVRKAEKLFMQGLSEVGGTIDSKGKIHIANREDEENGEGAKEILDAAPAVRYNRRTTVDEKAGTDYLIRNFSGEVKYDSEALSLSKEELAVISQAVKTGWGKLDADRIYGYVFSANSFCWFKYNADNSITIMERLDPNTEQEVIEIVKEVIESETRRKGKVENPGIWTSFLRNEGAGHRYHVDGDLQETGTRGSADPVVGGTRGSLGVGHQKSSGANRSNGQVSFHRNGESATSSEAQADAVRNNKKDDYVTFRGWADGILSVEDRHLLREQVADIKKRGYQGYIQLADGTLVLEVNNKIVLVSGDFQNPVYDGVVDVNVDNATALNEIWEVIENASAIEQGQSSHEFLEVVENLYREDVLMVYHKEDFGTSRTTSQEWRPTRPDGYKDFGYSAEQRYGERSPRKAENTVTTDSRLTPSSTVPVKREYVDITGNRRYVIGHGGGKYSVAQGTVLCVKGIKKRHRRPNERP